MEQKLHTPEGVRDIYNRECETKLALQKNLSTVLHLYGYQDIQTPTFEYYDVFREEIGSTSTQELYSTGTAISWPSGRISPRRSRGPRQPCLSRRISRSVSVMQGTPLSTIPAIRAV